MYRAMLAAALICAAAPVRADEISAAVPQECVEVAQRHGVPLFLTGRMAIASAIYRLKRLKNSEAGVPECKAAVRALLHR